LAAWTKDDDSVAVRPLRDRSPAGETVRVPIPGARDLWAHHGIQAVGERYILITHTVCPEGRQLRKCLFLQALDARGTPLGEPLRQETIEWASGFSATTDDSFTLLRSHTYLPPVLERFSVRADGTMVREELGDLAHGLAQRGDAEPPRGVALAVRDQDVVAWVRVPGEETSQDFLHFAHGDPVPFRLPEADVSAESLELYDDVVLLHYRGRAGPRTVRVSRDGALGEPEPVRPREASVSPRLSTLDGRSYSFGLSHPGHEWVAEPVSLSGNFDVGVGGRLGHHAVVESSTSRRSPRTITLRTIDCAEP